MMSVARCHPVGALSSLRRQESDGAVHHAPVGADGSDTFGGSFGSAFHAHSLCGIQVLAPPLGVRAHSSRVSGCSRRCRGGRHLGHGVMVFSLPLCLLLLAGHDQGVIWPLCVGAAALNSLHGVRIGLLLRAVTIRNVAFRVSLSSLFFSASPALRWN